MPITITQAAQERESLQREGDQLNEAIKVAEKEIRLLQRTLQSLVIRNDNFRASFHKVRACVCFVSTCLLCFCLWDCTIIHSCARVFVRIQVKSLSLSDALGFCHDLTLHCDVL